MDYSRRLKEIWNQGITPVVLRRGGKGETLRIRLPIEANEFDWISHGRQHAPVWVASHSYWELGSSRFNDFVEAALNLFGRLYLIQPYREQEVCAPACRNAKGHDCSCSCMGAHHGVGDGGGWFDVSDAFSTRWNDREVACRLMVRRTDG